jgi:hypothetical protein
VPGSARLIVPAMSGGFLYTTNAVEALNAKLRRAVPARRRDESRDQAVLPGLQPLRTVGISCAAGRFNRSGYGHYEEGEYGQGGFAGYQLGILKRSRAVMPQMNNAIASTPSKRRLGQECAAIAQSWRAPGQSYPAVLDAVVCRRSLTMHLPDTIWE